MRTLTVFGCVSLFLSTAASAQTGSKGNISFGYSYVRGTLSSKSPLFPTISSSSLNRWYMSAEYKLVPWLGAVTDFGGDYGTESVTAFCEVIPVFPGPLSAHANVPTFLLRPRASVSIGKVRRFAPGLFGGAHTSANRTGFSNSDTSLGTALGGAADFCLAKTIGWRVESDYLQSRFFGSSQNNFRFSTGVVVRF